MSGDEERMQGALGDVRDEARHHASRCAVASSMVEVNDELDRHEHAMESVMARMDGAMGEMHGMHCSGSGMGDLMDTVSGLEAERQTHHANMGDAIDLATARQECLRYRDRMTTLCGNGIQQTGAVGCM
jgi:hypothetical protein